MSEAPDNTDRPSVWRSMRWPVIVGVLLAGHVFIITGALLLSSTLIPAAFTAPAGYEEALKWDELKALRERSAELGWTLEIEPTNRTEINGDRLLAMRLLDRDGAAINDAVITLRIYHLARPDEVQERVVSVGDEGLYATSLRMRREGAYQLTATVERGADTMLMETEVWVSAL